MRNVLNPERTTVHIYIPSINNETYCFPLHFWFWRFIIYVPVFFLGKLSLEKAAFNLGTWLKNYLVISVLLKEWNRINDLVNFHPILHFTNEEITGCTTEAIKGAIKAQINQLSWFLVLCFIAKTLISTPESSRNFTVKMFIIHVFIRNEQSEYFLWSYGSFFTYSFLKFIYCI